MSKFYLKILLFVFYMAGCSCAVHAADDWVSTEDFQIGPTGSEWASSQHSSGFVNEYGLLKRRELASLATGDRGLKVPSKGLMTDVVWVEAITPDPVYSSASTSDDATTTRIIYYGFNIDRWQRQLTAETSVLARVFMSQPMLVFLSNEDKAVIAEKVVKAPYFSQTTEQYEFFAHGNHPEYSPAELDDLIEALSEYGLSLVTDSQLSASREQFSAKADQFIRTRLGDTINFDDDTQKFEAFGGLRLSGDRTVATNEPRLSFISKSSLTYGVQTTKEFNDVTGDFIEDGKKHFLKAPLISPVVGWTGIRSPETTNQKLSKYPELDSVGGTQKLVIYRNNPNTLVDAPMAINLVVAASITIEHLAVSTAFFKPDAIKGYFKKVEEFLDKINPYVEWAGLIYTLAKSGQELICNTVNEKEGLCGDFIKNIDRTLTVARSFGLGKLITDTQKVIGKEQENETFNATGYCAGLVLDVFQDNIRKTDRLSKSESGDGYRSKLVVCAFDLLITKPLLAQVEKYLPTTYKKTFKKISSLRITADYLNRSQFVTMKIRGSQRIQANARLETVVALLLKSPVGYNLGKNTIASMGQVLSVSNGALDFAKDVNNGKVQWKPLLVNLKDALVDTLQEKGEDVAADAIATVLKNASPAKYVQMAHTLGNKGTKLAADWMTDPSVIKLTLKRTSDTEIDISHQIPRMIAIRYLEVPVDNNRILHSTSVGVHKESVKNAWIYPFAEANEANHFLVRSGFKASLENQSAFEKVDKATLKELVKGEKVKMRWNVKKLENSTSNTKIPYKSRNSSDFNDIEVTVEHSYFPWKNAIVGLDEGLKINKSTFDNDTLNIDDYQAMDFSEVYKEQLGGSDGYALHHLTTGIFSDYTHFHIRTLHEAVTYSNQMTVYVLKNLRALQNNMQINSRRYEERVDGSYSGVGEIQLRFNHSSWDEVGQHGVWATWYQLKDGVASWTTPVSLGSIATGDERVIMYPADADRSNTSLYLYEDNLNGYLNNTSASNRNVFNTLKEESTTSWVPFVEVKLTDLKKTNHSLIQSTDSDGDEVPDYLDAFPDDIRYQHDSDGDGIADSWEETYKLAPLNKADSRNDPDEDDYTNLQEFLADTHPRDKTSYPEESGAPRPLNDTGITQCSDGDTNGLSCPVADYPDQDAQYGRDSNSNDDSDGHAGFSFTKLDANGKELLANATDWSCVKDNVTGLIWEVKQGGNGTVGDEGLHDADDSFNWYTTDTSNDGGYAGVEDDDGAICHGYNTADTASYCNTQAYVERVNEQGLCGASDWRLPTTEELLSIVSFDRLRPSIDTEYFPSTVSSWYWSSVPYAGIQSYAWFVHFASGYHSLYWRHYNHYVRLVRIRE